MLLTRFRIGPFRGVVTSLEARNIPPGAAQDARDARVEDGAVATRYGFGTPVDSVTGQTTNKLFSYVQGFSSGTFVDAYLAADKVSGTLSLYEIDTECLRRTEVTASGTFLSLTDSYWRCAPFEDKVYIWNYSSAGTSTDPGPLMEYTVNDYDSLRRIAPPTAPASPPTVSYAKNSTGGTTYKIVRWSGADPVTPGDANEVSYDGTIASSTGTALSGENFEVEHLTSGGLGLLGTAYVQFQLNNVTAGDQDLQNVDCATFTLIPKTPASFQIDPQKVQFFVGNSSAGSADTELAVTAFPEFDSTGNLTRVDCYAQFTDKTRASWATTRYVKVAYSVTKSDAAVANNHLFISPVTLGGVLDWPSGPIVGYSWYETTTALESGVSPMVELAEALLRGDVYPPSKNSAETLFMGSHPVVNTTSTSEADTVRVYIAKRVKSDTRTRTWSKWRRAGSQADTDTTFPLAVSDKEFSSLTEYSPDQFVFTNLLCAGQYKGSMCWGYRGGEGNVRISRVNEPLLLASDSDVVVYGAIDPDDPDPFRGATFSLTDNFTDSPKGFVGLGEVLGIPGDYGFYAMVGVRPIAMRPPKPVKGAPGCFGYESFCSWRDSGGAPACCYIAPGGSVWMVTVSPAFDGDAGATVVELTKHVRGLIDSFLYGGSVGPSFEAAHIWIDRDDALNLFYNGRRMVLRRPSLIDDVRDWELYSYEDGAQGGQWNKAAHSQLRGTKVLRLTGQVDEIDYNTVRDDVTGEPLWTAYTGAALVPTTTDTTNENVGFEDDPRWASGSPVTPSATGGGLTAATVYYVRKVTFQVFELYDSEANAENRSSTTGRRNVTGSVTQNIRHASTASGGYLPFSTDTANDRLTMKDGPGWVDGTPLEVAVDSGGLLAADLSYGRRQTFYVRYEFYDTEAHAIDFAATTGRVNLTATITATITPGGRDAGSAVPATGLYWRSKKHVERRRRVDSVYVDRADLTESVTVSVVSGRQSAVSRTVGAGQRNARYSSSQVDEVHDFKIKWAEGNDPVYGLEPCETPLSPRRHA